MQTKIQAFYQCVVLSALAMSPSVYAVPQGGFVGLKAGYSKNDHSCEPSALECDRSGSGYGIFGGYDFNRRFGVELGFTDTGDSSAVYPEISLDGEISIFDISAKYSRPLYGDSRVFAKLGVAYWQGEVKGWGVKVDGSGFSPALGVGVTLPFADRFSARLEYQYFGKVGDSEIGHTQPSFLSLGLTWHLGPRTVAVPYPESFLPDTTSSEAEAEAEQTDLLSTSDSSLETDLSSPAALTTESTIVNSSAETVVSDDEASPAAPENATALENAVEPERAPESEKTTESEKTAEPETDSAPESTVEPKKAESIDAEVAPKGPVIIDDHSNSPLFAKGSAVLKINYALEKIAVELLRNPQLFVHIIVHTDDLGSSESNQQLSKARADKLADYLIWQGVNPDHITVEGKGETSPIVKKNTEAARARNRRAELFISETRPRR